LPSATRRGFVIACGGPATIGAPGAVAGVPQVIALTDPGIAIGDRP